MCRPVNEDDQIRLDLCTALCTQAGIMFEDLSPRAIMVGSLGSEELAALIRDLRRGADEAAKLLAAAEILARP